MVVIAFILLVVAVLLVIAAVFGGLELEPATSPPVLRRIPDWPRRPAGVAASFVATGKPAPPRPSSGRATRGSAEASP